MTWLNSYNESTNTDCARMGFPACRGIPSTKGKRTFVYSFPGAKRAIIQATPPPATNTPANTPTPPTLACTFTMQDGMTPPWVASPSPTAWSPSQARARRRGSGMCSLFF